MLTGIFHKVKYEEITKAAADWTCGLASLTMKFELRPLFREHGMGEGGFGRAEHHLTAYTSHKTSRISSLV